jgi:cytochrome c biogenesis protein CcdA
MVVAFGAGMLATVNPCGFVMLPAFLAYYLGGDQQGHRAAGAGGGRRLPRGLSHGVAVGLAASAGFAGVFTLAGLLVAVGLRQLVTMVPWVAVAIGGLLVVLGAALAAGRQPLARLRLGKGGHLGPTNSIGGGSGLGQVVAFGGAYAVASLSCTLGVVLAVVAQATATASPTQTLGVFATFAVGAATVLVSVTVAAGLATASLVGLLGRVLPVVDRLGGVILALSGAYLLVYWLPVLAGRAPAGVLAVVTERPSAVLSGLLDTHQTLVGSLAGVLVVAGLLAVLVRRRHVSGPSRVQALDEEGGCCAHPAGRVGDPEPALNGVEQPVPPRR